MLLLLIFQLAAVGSVGCGDWLTARRAFAKQRLNPARNAQLQLWADWVVWTGRTPEAVDLGCYRNRKLTLREL